MKTITTNRITITKHMGAYHICFPDRLVSRAKSLPKFIRAVNIDIIQTGQATQKTFNIIVSKGSMTRPIYTIKAKSIDLDKEIKLKSPMIQKHEYGFRAEWKERIGNAISLTISSIINIHQPWRTV